MSPEQAIFSRVREVCSNIEDTYDVLPPDSVRYPFVYVGEQFDNHNREHIDFRNDIVHQTVHVWHNNLRQRGTVSKLIHDIKTEIDNVRVAFGYRVSVQAVSTQTLPEDNLWHGIIEFQFKINV